MLSTTSLMDQTPPKIQSCANSINCPPEYNSKHLVWDKCEWLFTVDYWYCYNSIGTEKASIYLEDFFGTAVVLASCYLRRQKKDVMVNEDKVTGR